MTWKTLNKTPIGSATKYGGEDIDKINKAFNGTNVSDPIIYNTDQNTLKDSTTNAAGDILKSNGTKYVRMARGTANQVLAVNSGGTDLQWTTAAGGGDVTGAANVGSGTGQIFRDEVTGVLNLKSLLAGSNITLTNNANDITIASSGGGAASFAELGGAIYTAVISGTTVKLRNNITGANDYTADNSVNAITAIQSALNNIDNIANIDTEYGSYIELTPGVYKCTTTLDISLATCGRHGLGLIGFGPGTFLNFVPTGALTNGIILKMAYALLSKLRIRGNSNVVNLVRREGVNWGTDNTHPVANHGIIEYCKFEGANARGTDYVPIITGQTGIYDPGTYTPPNLLVPFHWNIYANTFVSLDTGINQGGIMATSAHITDNKMQYVNTGVDIAGNQNIVTGLWVQGRSDVGHTGVRLRSNVSNNEIHSVVCELAKTSPSTNSQAIQIDSGAARNSMSGISNALATAATTGTACVVRDSSGNNLNRYDYAFLTGGTKDNFSHNVSLQNCDITGGVLDKGGVKDGYFEMTNYFGYTVPFQSTGTNVPAILDLKPTHTAASTTRQAGTLYVRNLADTANNEFLQIMANGVNGYVVGATKSGSGTNRDLTIQANLVDAMVFKGASNQIEVKNTMDFIMPNRGGAIYTAVIAGTTVKLRNNITGVVDYTADNTVNAVTAIQSALNNIDTIPNIHSTWGGAILLTPGVYKMTTDIDLSQTTTGRHGLGLVGSGPGTVLNWTPASALTNCIYINESFAQIRDLNIKLNTNCVNAIRIQGNYTDHESGANGSDGVIDNVLIQGPNAGGTNFVYDSQIGILMDPAGAASFFWKITNNTFHSLDIGLYCSTVNSTSTFTVNNTFVACRIAIFLNSAQHNVVNVWHQAHGGAGETGVKLGSGATYNNIVNVTCENNSGTESQAILLDSGATRNRIVNTTNAYATAPTSGAICVIRDNSGNISNMYQYTYGNENYSTNNTPVKGYSLDVLLQNTTAYSGNSTTIQSQEADVPCSVGIEPGYTAVGSARSGAILAIRNSKGANAEYLSLETFGTAGYYIQAVKQGTGVVRDLTVRAAGADAMIFKGTSNTITVDPATKFDVNITKQYQPRRIKRNYFSFSGGSASAGEGLFNGNITPAASQTYSLSSFAGGTAPTFTTGGTSGNQGGFRTNTVITERAQDFIFRGAFHLTNAANVRGFIGFVDDAAAFRSGNDPLNAKSGIGIGWDITVDANFRIFHNDGSGVTVRDNWPTTTAIDVNDHAFEIRADNTNSRFQVYVDSMAVANITTDIPAANTDLAFQCYNETTTASARVMWLMCCEGDAANFVPALGSPL
jgi:hypothetical protein